jgi:hypothetical protein
VLIVTTLKAKFHIRLALTHLNWLAQGRQSSDVFLGLELQAKEKLKQATG